MREMFLYMAAWPYYWTLKHFTILPIQKMVKVQHHGSRLREESEYFIQGKIQEVKFVILAVCNDTYHIIKAFHPC